MGWEVVNWGDWEKISWRGFCSLKMSNRVGGILFIRSDEREKIYLKYFLRKWRAWSSVTVEKDNLKVEGKFIGEIS